MPNISDIVPPDKKASNFVNPADGKGIAVAVMPLYITIMVLRLVMQSLSSPRGCRIKDSS